MPNFIATKLVYETIESLLTLKILLFFRNVNSKFDDLQDKAGEKNEHNVKEQKMWEILCRKLQEIDQGYTIQNVGQIYYFTLPSMLAILTVV